MQKDKNNIGSILMLFKEVASEMGARYSHGNITETDMRSMLVYPYIHINIGNAIIGDVLTTYSVNIMIADRVNIITTDNQGLDQGVLYSEYGYTENNNYAFVLQNLLNGFIIAMRKKQILYYNSLFVQVPYQLEPFEETYEDVLAGFTGSISIDVVSPLVTDGIC